VHPGHNGPMEPRPRRRAPRLAVPQPEPGAAPGSWADVPAEPHRSTGVRAVAVLAVWATAGWAAVVGLGVGGWRGGWAISVAWWAVGAGTVCWWALNGVTARGTWTAAVAIIGLVVGVKAAALAPESTARLDARIDHMGITNAMWYPVAEHRSGHGWCSPHCPEVVRVFRSPNDSLSGGVALALAALYEQRLEKDVKGDYNRQAGLVIARRDAHVIETMTLAEVRGRVQLTVDVRSR
jgi:hypothetical protein